jgi:hypothetical protein
VHLVLEAEVSGVSGYFLAIAGNLQRLNSGGPVVKFDLQAQPPIVAVNIVPSAARRARAMNGRNAAIAAGDVATVNSRSGPHSGHPDTSDISDPMAGFKVLLTLPA